MSDREVNVGNEVMVIGRPYGDCPEMNYQLQNVTPAGTILKVERVYTEPDGAQLSDGFQYPAASYTRLHTFVDGFCSHCLCLERDKDLLACMTIAEAKKACDEAEPAPFTKSEIDNMVDFVLHGPGGP